MADVELNVKGLEKILKALKGKQPVGRIGVLGSGNSRGDNLTNATIGAFHEFGTSKLPVRSFLRLPISALLEKELGKSGAFDKDTLAQVIAQGSIRPWLEKVVIVAEGIVADAFDTRGFGTWIPSDYANKENEQTLVETGQLRNSITSDVIG